MKNTFMDILSDDFFKAKEFNLEDFIDDLGDLDKITSMELLDKICFLNKENRYRIFNNGLIRNKLRIGLLSESENDQWYHYRKILSKISTDEFLSLYDADFLNEYFMIHEGEYLYRFWASLCEIDFNNILNMIIDDDKMLGSFLKESNNFESLFVSINYDLLIKLICKLQEKNSSFDYDFLACISKENQYLLLDDTRINDDTLVHLISVFYNEVKSHFFQNNKRALYLYNKFCIPALAKAGVKFSDDILKKKEFFELLKDRSLIIFRSNINNIEKRNNPFVIEKHVKKYYEDILSLYSSDCNMFTCYREILDNPSQIVNWDKNISYLFDFDIIDKITCLLRRDDSGSYFFLDRDALEIFLISETSKKMSEIIIDAIFQDNIYNVWLNVKEMLRYNNGLALDEKVLDNEKVYFYNYVINFDSLSNINKMAFYNSFKDKNASLMFYQDLRRVKDYAYDKIKKELFNVNMVDNKTFSGDVTIYDARDINYNMLVRTQAQYRDTSHYPRNCYSIISNENTSVFGESDYNSFLYGYNGFDNDMVLHMFESDSFSSGFRDTSSRFVNRIMNTRELVQASYSYSEIQLVNKKNEGKKHNYIVQKPDFIVVFDNVRNMHIEEAKRLGIPIVIIKKKKLESKIDIDFNDDMNSYVENIYNENEYRVRR